MGKLDTTANIDGADDFYAELLALHEGQSKEDSDAINARLIATAVPLSVWTNLVPFSPLVR